MTEGENDGLDGAIFGTLPGDIEGTSDELEGATHTTPAGNVKSFSDMGLMELFLEH